jgi:hypothetical protein
MSLFRRRSDRATDVEACVGDNAIERAANWALHVFEREYPDQRLASALVLFEAEDEDGVRQLGFAGSSTRMPMVTMLGMVAAAQHLMSDSLTRAVIDQNVKRYTDEILPQITKYLDYALDERDRQESRRPTSGRDPRDPGQEETRG